MAKKNQPSYTIKLTQVSDTEWVTELYKDEKLIKTYDRTLYSGAVALASQFLLRAPYVELV